jgi:endonuclease/exonuclease/phosphatase (EEP) superfamily protein YafD
MNEIPEIAASEPLAVAERPDSEPAEVLPRRDGWQLLTTVWFGGAWCVVALLAWLTLTREFDVTFPAIVTVLLQSLLPLVFLPVYVILVTAVVSKRWFLTGACALLAVVHIASVYPALGHRNAPDWVTTAPKLTVLEANLYDRNPTPTAAAARIVSTTADVLALVEISPQMLAALEAAGIDRAYPYSARRTGPDILSNIIWSRTPFTSEDYMQWSSEAWEPLVTVDVGGRSLQIIAVHVDNSLRGRSPWRTELTGIAQHMTQVDGPGMVIGDFNATRWNPPFGKLLGSGLTDAHEATGHGLSRSWPARDFPVPLMRIDHALTNRHAFPVAVHDVSIPGSDHAGFTVDVAVGP